MITTMIYQRLPASETFNRFVDNLLSFRQDIYRIIDDETFTKVEASA